MKNLGEFKYSKCGWVHAGISPAEAIAAVDEFSRNFATTRLEAQADFGGKPASLERYKQCFRCGAAVVNFLPTTSCAAPEDVAVGPEYAGSITPNQLGGRDYATSCLRRPSKRTLLPVAFGLPARTLRPVAFEKDTVLRFEEGPSMSK